MSDVKEKSLEGIAGWLILPLLGLIIAPLRVSFFLYQQLLPVFTEGHWATLTTPGSGAYHPLWAPLLIGEIVGNVSVIALSLVALFFFLRRSLHAPKLVIASLAFSLLFVGADFFLADLIPAVAEQNDTESAKELGRAIMGAVIWIPYFLVSKRVKATFTR